MLQISRRRFLHHAIGSAALVSLGGPAFARAVDGITAGEQEEIAGLAAAYIAEFGAPGVSFAIGRHGSLLYAEGFGVADPATGAKVVPANLFRIASISKPVTSVTVFTLIEQGKLSLDAKVFGRNGILRSDYGTPKDRRIENITVEHLLTHTGGGWPNKGRDPMFLHPDFDQRRLITWTLANVPLDHEPGTVHAYSNFGYCLLGRVVEKVTGQRYGAYVRDAVLQRCGIGTMRIGAGPRAERAPNEVVYAGQGGDPYRVRVARADSCGGWIASASDLVRFAMHVDGASNSPNILRPETIGTMTTPSAINPKYAKGWIVGPRGWWHNGSLPGTSAILASTRTGLCWAALANTRRRDPNSVGGLNRVAGQMVQAARSLAG